MALHLKSTKSFKILIGVSALLISAMAATFSVTGIATLFSGYFLTVALMMGVLEFGKIVVASFLARYWNAVSRVLRGYFIVALAVLILITSGGIFGYLSDAYQKTKGDYTIVEKQTSILNTKKNAFVERKERLQSDRLLELKVKQSNQTRADSLTSRGQSITRTRDDIKASDIKIAALETQISGVEDSIGVYDLKIVDLESQNIQGELGPLKYIAGIFDTDMDTVTKYFIFLLIFVFDPLAVLLFVSLNMIIRKEHGMYEEDETEPQQETPVGSGKVSVKIDDTEMEVITNKLKDGIENTLGEDEVKKNLNNKITEDLPGLDWIEQEEIEYDDIENKIDSTEEFVNELVENFEHEINSPLKTDEEEKEHEFYHDEKTEEVKEEVKEEIPPKPKGGYTVKSANYHPPT